MSIVTGKGDDGNTYILPGRRLRKDSLIFEVLGTIDELSFFLGAAASLIKEKRIKSILEKVQDDLLFFGSQVSGTDSCEYPDKPFSRKVIYLEREIDKIEKRKHLSHDFVKAGSNIYSSLLHVARTVARRLERRMVSLNRKKRLKNKKILVYFNRLSDLLFLLACLYNSDNVD